MIDRHRETATRPHRSSRLSLGVAIVILAALPALGLGAPECRDAFYSPATPQFAGGAVIYPQNAYAVGSGSPLAGDVFPTQFLQGMQIDALHAISPYEMLFSVDRPGIYSNATESLVLFPNRPYLVTSWGGVEVSEVPEWDALGIQLRTLNALHYAGGCFAFSVSAPEFAPGVGVLYPSQVHRKCPGEASEIVLNGASLGIGNVDAVHLSDEDVEFSSATNRFLWGGPLVANQSTYRCAPVGGSCAPGGVTPGFNGAAIGLQNLNAFTEGDGMTCDDGNGCTVDTCQDEVCVGEVPDTCFGNCIQCGDVVVDENDTAPPIGPGEPTMDCSDDPLSDVLGPGVWYSFIGTGDWVRLSTCDTTTFDTRIDVFQGDCDALECVAGNDDAEGCGGFSSVLGFQSEEGEIYSIFVSGFGGATGSYELRVCPECEITDVALDPFWIPDGGLFCQADGTYFASFRIDGPTIDTLPRNGDGTVDSSDWRVVIDGAEYPAIGAGFDEVTVPGTTYLYFEVIGIPGDGDPNVDVTVEVGGDCTFTAVDLYDEPACVQP
ncbi:MAG: hypothetical protein GY716_22440 [bacterium]|nr:hypothetical protein [bacterium]